MLKDKRGLTLNSLYPAVLAIVLVGIVLGVGLFVLSEVRLGIATDYTGLDYVNGSGTTNANVSTLGDASNTGYYLTAAPTIIYNETGATVSDFIWTEAGLITFNDSSPEIANGVNITSIYNYDATDSPEAATNTFVTGLATFADWIAIIVVVIAAAVVLGLVLNSFGRNPGV